MNFSWFCCFKFCPFSQERVKASLFCSINKKGPRYGYIANLCVSQSARRQRIASNMLNLAIRSAKSNGEMLKLNSSLGFLSQCQYLGKYVGKLHPWKGEMLCKSNTVSPLPLTTSILFDILKSIEVVFLLRKV